MDKDNRLSFIFDTTYMLHDGSSINSLNNEYCYINKEGNILDIGNGLDFASIIPSNYGFIGIIKELNREEYTIDIIDKETFSMETISAKIVKVTTLDIILNCIVFDYRDTQYFTIIQGDGAICFDAYKFSGDTLDLIKVIALDEVDRPILSLDNFDYIPTIDWENGKSYKVLKLKQKYPFYMSHRLFVGHGEAFIVNYKLKVLTNVLKITAEDSKTEYEFNRLLSLSKIKINSGSFVITYGFNIIDLLPILKIALTLGGIAIANIAVAILGLLKMMPSHAIQIANKIFPLGYIAIGLLAVIEYRKVSAWAKDKK